MALESHNTSGLADADPPRRAARQREHARKLLQLRRLADAWLFCDAVDEDHLWRELGEAAIADLDVEFGR